jgi:Bacterial regulatory protein, arsR family
MIAGDIAEELGISPASLSYHLNLLKKNDLVIESKEKIMFIMSLTQPCLTNS